jgi:hypothetical protein
LVDQFGSSRLLLRSAWEVGRSTTLRATDGQRDRTIRRCLGASQDPQSKLGGRDEQRLAEGLGVNAADIPVAMSVSGTSVWTGRALQVGYDGLEIVGLAHLYSAL